MYSNVATLHIRNVPEDLYEELRASADANGRSLNAEVIVRLGGTRDEWRGNSEWWDRFVARGERMRMAIPAGAPSPEEVIRATRDAS